MLKSLNIFNLHLLVFRLQNVHYKLFDRAYKDEVNDLY